MLTHNPPLFSQKFIFLFTLAIAVLMVVLFPRTSLPIALASQPVSDPVAVFYLNQFTEHPSGNKAQIWGDYYFTMVDQVSDVADKRLFVLAGLRSYQTENLLTLGLAQVKKLKPDILNDKTVLLFLIDYALAANRPDLAQYYTQQLLALPENSS